MLYLVIENVSLPYRQNPSTHKKFYFITGSKKPILYYFVRGGGGEWCDTA
jgi:hypothetical protein